MENGPMRSIGGDEQLYLGILGTKYHLSNLDSFLNRVSIRKVFAPSETVEHKPKVHETTLV